MSGLDNADLGFFQAVMKEPDGRIVHGSADVYHIAHPTFPNNPYPSRIVLHRNTFHLGCLHSTIMVPIVNPILFRFAAATTLDNRL